MAKRVNPNLAKIHRNYTVEEIALLFKVHKNTVRGWIKEGLPTTDSIRPALVLGSELRAFLIARRVKRKRHCPPGTIYCVRCKEPKIPAGKMVDYQPITEAKGNLIGICPDCEAIIHQFIGLARLEQIGQVFDVSMPLGEKHISGCS